MSGPAGQAGAFEALQKELLGIVESVQKDVREAFDSRAVQVGHWGAGNVEGFGIDLDRQGAVCEQVEVENPTVERATNLLLGM